MDLPDDRDSKDSNGLSDYFPKDTVYFYGFPAGEHSGFYNQVPPWKEELVAARPLTYAGDHVKMVTFATSATQELLEIMRDHLHMPIIKAENILKFPKEITTDVVSDKRNAAITSALKNMLSAKNFVMAQPLLEKDLMDHYLIDPNLTVRLNDKINMGSYISRKYMPEVYAIFKNGQEFSRYNKNIPFPCVVKISSSSAGDGVRICKNKEDFEKVKQDFQHIRGNLIIEKFIESIKNLGVQFGISHDKSKPIEIIGYSEQLTTDQGEYLGGIISNKNNIKAKGKIYKMLKEEMLPLIRSLGWYGVGGIDVLIDKNDDIFFIDPNFRMVAVSSYVLLNKKKKTEKSLISFTGKFEGSKEDLLNKIIAIARNNDENQILEIIAMTKNKDFYGLNAGMFFSDPNELRKNAERLIKCGIKSNVLDKIVASSNIRLEQ